MLFYVIVFCAVGFAIGLFLPARTAGILMVAIPAGWVFVWGVPWAVAAFIELFIGYSAALALKKKF
ncbi:MAG: hypothetical protein J5855_02665 [Mailhella sp.]|nr:hypothetical protein [Mailhella sp.]